MGFRSGCLRRHIAGAVAFALAVPALASDEIETITVTAESRPESEQHVPAALTVFDGDDLESVGVRDVADIVRRVPNLTLDESYTFGTTSLQVRGVSQLNLGDSPMAIVVDGVPQNDQKQFRMALLDAERIEVLKGPQGALFGRNAVGGAINLVTRGPGDTLEGRARMGMGKGRAREIEAAVGGPLFGIPELGFRLAGLASRRDGVVENRFVGDEVDFQELLHARLRLQWRPAQSPWKAEARVSVQDDRGTCCAYAYLPATLGRESPLADDFPAPDANVLGRTRGPRLTDTTLRLERAIGGGTLTATSAMTDLAEDYFGDIDYTHTTDTSLAALFGSGVGQQQRMDLHLLSQELRFVSPSERRLRWIAGGYVIGTDRDLDTVLSLDPQGTEPVRSDDAFVPVLLIRENNRNLAWSLFGQTEYDLAERWELTLGLRYDRDRRHHLGRAPVRTDRTEHFDDWQPRAVLSWRPSASTNAYASYARGFRSGGFNPPSVDSQRFDQETLDSFELGIKRDWLDRRLRTNLALFQARSRDYQTYYVDVSRAAQVLDNIDRVRMQGFELDLSARLGAGFSVALGVGVTDAEIRRYRARPQDQGNHAPRNQVLGTILGLEYLRRLPGGWAWQTLLEVDQRGRKYWHSVDRYSMPPFALLDARSRLDWQGGWIALWGRNLADEDYWQEYIAQEFAGLPGGDAGFRARGRTFGVDVGWTWD